jgi:hypothetical protein
MLCSQKPSTGLYPEWEKFSWHFHIHFLYVGFILHFLSIIEFPDEGKILFLIHVHSCIHSIYMTLWQNFREMNQSTCSYKYFPTFWRLSVLQFTGKDVNHIVQNMLGGEGGRLWSYFWAVYVCSISFKYILITNELGMYSANVLSENKFQWKKKTSEIETFFHDPWHFFISRF